MKRSWRLFALSLFLITVVVGSVFGDRILALSGDARQGLRAYSEVIDIAYSRYGTEVLHRDLVYSSIQGMLRHLDPHTSFLPPEAYSRMRERQEATFYGLGILVGVRNRRLTVIAPLEGTPASRRGLTAGDVIDTIDGEPTETMTLDDAVGKLKGPKDTEVTITLLRAGLDEALEVTITRAEIPQTTVRYAYMLDERTGYFRISDFRRSTGPEVEEAIVDLRAQGMERLILDLRNNGGGLLDQAIIVASQFVGHGERIVDTRGRTRDSMQTFDAESENPPLNLPLVVLVNSGSASASEIVSGAIQDHDLGLIVGTPTWGKGLVQTVYGLPFDAALALTTAKYYTPSGRLIQRDYTSVYDYYSHSDANGDEGFQPPAGEEVFHTDLGREVYGGGGITPDVLAELQPSPPLLQFLQARNAFFNFGVGWAHGHEVKDESWRPDAEVIDAFKTWLIEEDLGDPSEIEEAFSDEETRAETRRRIRAEIFNSEIGNDAWYRVLAENDSQIRAALEQMDAAAQLLKRRAALADPVGPDVQLAEAEESRPFSVDDPR